MADYTAPYDALKTFNGLIHRQPLFINNRLDVESYHLTFLDKNGEALNDDIEVPAFLEEMTAILPAISNRQKALLTMPESWRAALFDIDMAGIEITLDIYGNPLPDSRNRPFAFAGHANGVEHEVHTELLLIDLNRFDPASLTENLPHWRRRHEQLCATNVNALEQLSFCKSFAVDLLQGNFYTLPATRDSHKMPPSAQTLMELLVKLQNTDVEADELAQIINQDVTLSYKLLRLINSAFFGLPRQVSSTREAVVMLGHNKIKTWASLLCLSGLDHKPNELRSIAMIRARMCELLAKFYKGHSDVFFAAGLFSTLDALLDKPLAILLDNLPLSDELRSALLYKQGAAGQALEDVLRYERGDWQGIDNSPLPVEVLVRAYLDAIYWAKELNLQIND